ncbi:two-component system sensor histidine kinase/response regulator, partial [Methylobacterium hispanicum]
MSTTPPSAPPDGVPERGRILYIDDDPGLARLVQRGLKARGYVVETAPD